ncbi:MAG TPA: acetolactate synthase small subunit [Actinomycetes bacterium]|nr:acetolactate synthase small subunit [Actinomycetes bacterium]
MSTHTLSVLVENKPGVLARVSGLFSRRGFNIDSLAVGPTEDETTSRMTIVVDCASKPLEQVVKQLNKLVNVLKIVELEPARSIERELVLVKVRADGASRQQVVELAELFRARVVDVAPESLTVEVTGDPGKIGAMLEMLEPHGIRELVRTGRVGLARGSKGITDRPMRLQRSA